MLIAGMVVLGIALEETGLADVGRVAACFELRQSQRRAIASANRATDRA